MLLGVNTQLLALLASSAGREGGTPVEAVASAFSSVTPFFLSYAEYCANYFGALQLLQASAAACGVLPARP